MEHLKYIFCSKIGLQERHYNVFMQVAVEKSLRKKQSLITSGSVCDFLGIVTSGILRSFVRSDEEFNNDFYYDNSFISAYTSFLTRQPTNCNIEAISDSTILYITRGQLEQLIKEDIEWLKFSKYISDTFFIKKCKRETSFLLHSAAERLESIKELYPEIEQKVSQYHIASYLGVKPESLSRIKLLTYIKK